MSSCASPRVPFVAPVTMLVTLMVMALVVVFAGAASALLCKFYAASRNAAKALKGIIMML